MDNTKAVTHISLCAGYGGIDLGLKRAIPNLLTVAFSEIEAFACANLVAKMEAGLMDAAPVWSNLKTFPWESFRGRVDILSGGYPCQPFSAAGKRLGKDDPRHLWPFIADGIRILRPRLCFFENVEGHISLGLRDVIEQLGSLGYAATWGIFSASEVGAPHQRKRVFILAHCKEQGLEGLGKFESDFIRNDARKDGSTAWPSRPGQPQHGWEPPRVVVNSRYVATRTRPKSIGAQLSTSGIPGHAVADAVCNGSGESWPVQQGPDGTKPISHGESWGTWPIRPGEPQHAWESPRVVGNTEMLDGSRQATGQWEAQARRAGAEWHNGQTEPAMGRDADGSASGMDYAELCVSGDNRTDELRLLGNGVVPAVAALAFRTLLKQLK